MRKISIVALGIAEIMIILPEIVILLFRLPIEYLLDRICKEYSYLNWLGKDLADCHTILDVGCGLHSPLLELKYPQNAMTHNPQIDAIDIHLPYVLIHERDYTNIEQANAVDYDYPDKKYDAIVICDVLEHIAKNEVFQSKLLDRIEKAACKKVILFTPNRFIENDVQEGNDYQKHLSAWEAKDFISRGYTVKGACGLSAMLGKAGAQRFRPYIITRIITLMSLPFIRNKPEIADHSYAVKVVK